MKKTADDKRIRNAQRELRRILRAESTHAALHSHWSFDKRFWSTPDPLVRLRKSLRRVLDTLDRRVK